MPPRLCLRSLSSSLPAATSTCSYTASIPTFLVPFLSQSQPQSQPQSRSASILSSLSDVPSAYNKRIRRGRGPSSGKGKTAGRGTKGQKARGSIPTQLTGGQTPDGVVHGHFGFKNPHSIEMSPVNLDRIQSWIDAGRINPSHPITLKELTATRAIHGIKDGVKLLARGSTALTSKINIVVSRASASAIAAVEALGGTVTTRYYTPLAIRHIRDGKMHPYVSLKWDQTTSSVPEVLRIPNADTPEEKVKALGFEYRLPDPTGRKDMEYYRDAKNRGYLRYLVKEGYSPSLFRKTALQKREEEADNIEKRARLAKQKQLAENRLW